MNDRQNKMDVDAVLREAAAQMGRYSRRSFLKHVTTLGGLSLLTGCSISDESHVEDALGRISKFNDKVQAWLFDPKRLAQTYSEAEITRPFPFNAYYSEKHVPHVDAADFRLEVGGKVSSRHSWTLAELRVLPQVEQITRHICVEGWSAIGRWGGVPFAEFLKRIGADTSAKYVAFHCADDYYTSIDMATALHPQTQLTLSFDGQVLPPKYGFPMKVRMPTKLGYKNPKHVRAISITNIYPGATGKTRGTTGLVAVRPSPGCAKGRHLAAMSERS